MRAFSLILEGCSVVGMVDVDARRSGGLFAAIPLLITRQPDVMLFILNSLFAETIWATQRIRMQMTDELWW